MSLLLGLSGRKMRLGSLGASGATLALVLSASPSAHAQNPNCPPGSWFCGDAQNGAAPAPAPEPGQLQPLPPPTAAPPPAAPAPAAAPAPPPPTVTVAPRDVPPPYVYTPRVPPRKEEWGLNLHMAGLALGKNREGGSSGGGLIGGGLRFRPLGWFALQADLDLAAARDYNGFRRTEAAFTINSMVFFNPKDRLQVYALGGMGWAGATAVDDRSGSDRTYHYSYFGIQGGLGLEFRVSKAVALNVDGRVFVRGRTDTDRRYEPEFIDSNGRSTNASGGALLNGGITFYF
jgi:opacity protein-like surface antigen